MKLFQPPIPTEPTRVTSWQGLPGAAASLAIVEASSRFDGLTLVLAKDPADAFRREAELQFFARSLGLSVLGFPDWETLTYDAFSPHQDIVSERLLTLYRLPRLQQGILVVPVRTLMQRLPPRAFIEGQTLLLKLGQTFDMEDYRHRFEQAGYRAVDIVSERGEFAVRGALMDVYPMGAQHGYRIDLFDNEIETLRTFDPDTQRTLEQVDQVRLLPAKEFPLTTETISAFRNRWHRTFDSGAVDVRHCPIYQDVSDGLAPSGIEYYLPLFFEQLADLFDYLPGKTLLIDHAKNPQVAKNFFEDTAQRYENLRHDIERPILPPAALFLRQDELNQRLNRYPRVVLDGTRHSTTFAASQLPDITVNSQARHHAQRLQNFLADYSGKVLFCAESAGRREVLLEFLKRHGISPRECPDFQTFLSQDAPCCLCIAAIDRSLYLPELAIICESQIFGQHAESIKQTRNRALDPDQIIRNLTELHIGSPVVHIDHGVGRYGGLQTLDIDGAKNEFLTLEYAEGAKLYVPVASLHLISRYSGADAEHAPLHRLGSDQWEKAKRRAAEKIHDAAAELLNIYARREVTPAHAISLNETDYQRFAEQFPFELTPDQDKAIQAVLEDLKSPRATDRLICGDVGFGKTEVAMRAAFAVVESGRQVAVLVPTTLLAQQHHETFRDRFADWPIQIDVVSRLRSESEVTDINNRLAGGKLDILIGTHKLLSDRFDFSNLGLVIVDEEHRFGVRQKERLKSLRAEVDILTLTATPIPRTLNLAMSGVRDLSIIATPPARRLAIKTFVQQKRKHLVREALTRELARGGQVFYLHNEVRTIEQTAREIQELMPQARIAVGHGQMPKRQLEIVMNDFHHRRINILVCTTIVETGIDIPNANTIIIERADKFGLAQLHQLRGRVGRSHRQAYAYLLTPHPKAMTADARKRLEAIEAAGELGIGFALATQDLEIRGAGELLGEEQSGQIQSIGLSLYMDMLDRAVKAIQEGKTPNLDKPLESGREMNLRVPALIPEDYLADPHLRLIMYKRISNADTRDELDALKVELIDRFGLLPDPLKNLFRVTELKLIAADLGITRFDLGIKGGKLKFTTETRVDPFTLVRMVQAEPNTFKLEDATHLRISRSLEDPDRRFRFAAELLQRLTPTNADIRETA